MTTTIVILAAGKGTRMLALSHDRPKHLIDVNQKPFLYYMLDNIRRAGFRKIVLVVGYKKEKMEQFSRQYPEFNLTLVDQFAILGTTKYGTACPIECVESVVGQHDFVVANGDDLYSVEDLKKIATLDHNYCYAAGFKSEHPEYYGLHQILPGNFLGKIIEKPRPDIDFDASRPLDYTINIGLYKFTPAIFEAVKAIQLSPRGEYELTDAITLLAQKRQVKVLPIHDYWLSFTNPDDVAKLEFFLTKKYK